MPSVRLRNKLNLSLDSAITLNKLDRIYNCWVPLRSHLGISRIIRMNSISKIRRAEASILVNNPDWRLCSILRYRPGRDSFV